ncbi:helix-turn-helix domain-containing protein [Paenibacillus thiaminolyticus]|uniref:helix-turn-helix domain-containing protein n=1 Tax=Paenibacillus thiaminolyticus TaxID=49283 RepID=UPI00232EB2F4|nr:helix-turn-helix transcriptional regulator [Paenibacillus thiaminolyticus]WCF11331.1 helix-turn-helix domain-containing protein [Paenibacillus thiaminolyticus]
MAHFNVTGGSKTWQERLDRLAVITHRDFFMMKELYSMLGERIREIRKKNKMNETEFSNLIGVSLGTLSELEQNKYNPSLETIRVNINAPWFLFGDAANADGLNEMDEEHNKVEDSFVKK